MCGRGQLFYGLLYGLGLSPLGLLAEGEPGFAHQFVGSLDAVGDLFLYFLDFHGNLALHFIRHAMLPTSHHSEP